ncbi:unnamed protein product [Linum tenue]|uniref:Uncharacterized protein n=1 Tax=Linum tenue TaxID=586396 RepID=A0AAV0HKI4_9ROSI|nr:unnamed protein product [Linum tenue]
MFEISYGELFLLLGATARSDRGLAAENSSVVNMSTATVSQISAEFSTESVSATTVSKVFSCLSKLVCFLCPETCLQGL